MYRKYLLGVASLLLLASCGTVETGDYDPGAGLRLDEDFFYCRIQPEVISAQGCATGGGGNCHASFTSLRLDPTAETDAPPECDGNFLVGTPPASYMANFQQVMFTIQPDPLSSPFYRRPVALDPHDEMFTEGSVEADLIIEWIGGGL